MANDGTIASHRSETMHHRLHNRRCSIIPWVATANKQGRYPRYPTPLSGISRRRVSCTACKGRARGKNEMIRDICLFLLIRLFLLLVYQFPRCSMYIKISIASIFECNSFRFTADSYAEILFQCEMPELTICNLIVYRKSTCKGTNLNLSFTFVNSIRA